MTIRNVITLALCFSVNGAFAAQEMSCNNMPRRVVQSSPNSIQLYRWVRTPEGIKMGFISVPVRDVMDGKVILTEKEREGYLKLVTVYLSSTEPCG